MKKGLFLSVMLFAVFVFGNCVPALAIFADHDAFVIAKAVKLGRGNAYSVAVDSEINTGQNELKKGECEKNSDCSGNKRCLNNKCVDYCYNISCIAGYTTEENSNGCCCVSLCSDNCTICSSSGSCTQCKSGYYLSNGSCVAEKSCGANCSVCDKTTGKCTTCESKYSLINGTCLRPSMRCLDLNCSDCDTSTGTCKACKSGYWLNGGKCESCPLHASCPDGVSFYCKSGYSASGGGCIACLTKYQVMAAVNNKVCGYESTGLSTDSKSACKQQVGTRFVCQSDYYYLQGLAQYKPYLSSIGGVNDKICDFCTSP